VLGNGLDDAGHHADALPVKEAELAMERRLGASEEDISAVQSNLACTYKAMGRLEEALNLYRDVYSGELKFYGAEHSETLISAVNYATTLEKLQRYQEAKSLLRRTMPVARRVLGDEDRLTLEMREIYAKTLCKDASATLGDLHEAVDTLEDTDRIARRVLGGENPTTVRIEQSLRDARAALSARETPSTSNNA